MILPEIISIVGLVLAGIDLLFKLIPLVKKRFERRGKKKPPP